MCQQSFCSSHLLERLHLSFYCGTYCQVENKNVGRVSHRLVENDDKNDEKVPDESNDDDEGEEYRDHNGDNCHQDLQVILFIFFSLLGFMSLTEHKACIIVSFASCWVIVHI